MFSKPAYRPPDLDPTSRTSTRPCPRANPRSFKSARKLASRPLRCTPTPTGTACTWRWRMRRRHRAAARRAVVSADRQDRGCLPRHGAEASTRATASCPSARPPRGAGEGRHRLHRPNPARIAAWATRSRQEGGGQGEVIHRARPPGRDLGRQASGQDRAEIGYPVMIKASRRRGGKGMRVAFNAKEARRALRRPLGGQVQLRRRPRVRREVHREPPPHRESRCWRQARHYRLPGRARMAPSNTPQPEGSRRRPRPCSTPRRARHGRAGRRARQGRGLRQPRARRLVVAAQDRSFYSGDEPRRRSSTRDRLVTGIDLVGNDPVAPGEAQVQAGGRELHRLGVESRLPRTPTDFLP